MIPSILVPMMGGDDVSIISYILHYFLIQRISVVNFACLTEIDVPPKNN